MFLYPHWDRYILRMLCYNGIGYALQVDCTTQIALCAKHEITGYPTLKFFPDRYSEVVRYKSARDLQSLQAFIEEQLSNVSVSP